MSFPRFSQFALIFALYLIGCMSQSSQSTSTEIENEIVLAYLDQNINAFPIIKGNETDDGRTSQSLHRLIRLEDNENGDLPEGVKCPEDSGKYQDTVLVIATINDFILTSYSSYKDLDNNILDICSLGDENQIINLTRMTHPDWKGSVDLLKTDYLNELTSVVHQEYHFSEGLTLTSDTLTLPFDLFVQYEVTEFSFEFQEEQFQVNLTDTAPDFAKNRSLDWAEIYREKGQELIGWMSINMNFEAKIYDDKGNEIISEL